MEIVDLAYKYVPDAISKSPAHIVRLDGVLRYVICDHPKLTVSYGLFAENKKENVSHSRSLEVWPSSDLHKLLANTVHSATKIQRTLDSLRASIAKCLADSTISFRYTFEVRHKIILRKKTIKINKLYQRHLVSCSEKNLCIHGGVTTFLKEISKPAIIKEIVEAIQYQREAEPLTDNLEYGIIAVAPDIMGLILHEAVGHALEKDNLFLKTSAMGRDTSFLRAINIKINPLIKNCGYAKYDDEGMATRPYFCVRHGKVIKPIDTLIAENYMTRPLPRMTSIYFEPDNWIWKNKNIAVRDILKSFRMLGHNDRSPIIYLSGWDVGTANWQDLSFNVSAKKAIFIRSDGECVKYKNVVLFGKSKSFLNSFLGSAGKLDVSSAGFCSKSFQNVMTSDGGPQINFFRKSKEVSIRGEGD